MIFVEIGRHVGGKSHGLAMNHGHHREKGKLSHKALLMKKVCPLFDKRKKGRVVENAHQVALTAFGREPWTWPPHPANSFD